MTPQETKAKAIEVLRRRTAEQRERLAEIDQRLCDYFDDLCQNSSAVKDDTTDRHGMYEILCAVRFLRLMRQYDFDMAAVKRAIHLREGNWKQDEQGRWQHVSGGLKCPSPTGDTVFRWLPFQVFVLAAIFGPVGVYDTHVRPEDKTTLLPTEFVGEARE